MSESMTSIVRRAAASHPDVADPAALVPFVMEEIAGMERTLLERLLPRYIAATLRGGGGGDAWDAILAERIPTEHGYVFGRDATAEDFEGGAVRRRKFAGNLDRRAQQYDDVAQSLRSTNTSHARDLGPVAIAELQQRLGDVRRGRMQAEAAAHRLSGMLAARDQLQGIVQAGVNPLAAELERRAVELRSLIADLEAGIERGRTADRLAQGG